MEKKHVLLVMAISIIMSLIGGVIGQLVFSPIMAMADPASDKPLSMDLERLNILGPAGNVRMSLYYDVEQKAPFLALYDSEGKARISASVASNNEADLRLEGSKAFMALSTELQAILLWHSIEHEDQAISLQSIMEKAK